MKQLSNIFHNIIIFITLLLVAFCFNFSVNASNTTQNTAKEQLTSSLIIKSQKAIIAGNSKMAESYLDQAKSIDPTLQEPNLFKESLNNTTNCSNDIEYKDENEFFEEIKIMPYNKAKIELDKKLLFNPSNSKLRLIYLELAEKNNDKDEASIQRNILGINQTRVYDADLILKYSLIIIVSLLILYEIISIFKSVSQIQTYNI